MLRALIFDFDGLILDTETPEVLVWQSIYKEHGFELPVEEWEKTVGGYGISDFDPAQNLSHLTQGRLFQRERKNHTLKATLPKPKEPKAMLKLFFS